MNYDRRTVSAEELRATFEQVLDREQPSGSAAVEVGGALSVPPAPLDLAAFLRLGDREFVEKAYVAILRRRPDEPGVRHYLARLIRGDSRILVLGELRYSAEGRATAIPAPGLRSRFLLHRLYRLKLLGRLLRTVTGIAALPGLLRDVARVSRELQALRMQSEDTDRAIEHEMRSRADFAERAIERSKLIERQVTQELAPRLGELTQRLEGLARRAEEEPWADPLLALAERFEDQAAQFEEMSRANEILAGRARDLGALRDALAAMQRELGWPETGAALARRFQGSMNEQRNLAARAIGVAEDSQAALRDQERRLSLILGEVRGWMARGLDAGAPERIAAHQDHLLDPLYVAFEDRFRGSRADIKQRQRVYLDLLKQAGAGTAARPIVDVGSGRGELLELFAAEGLQASGVDLNASMVALCHRLGLNCVAGDAVAYLSALPPDSLGAVTGFHIIEHLPFPVMVALFDASLRALAPGGVVVFETPNPANLLVASRWFHLDPTHRNPLPGEMVAMIAEARGFVEVSIRELHPMPRRFEAKDEVLAAQLDAIFHGPQDYALIARKA